MRTFKLTLAYDGSNYHGWQTQPGRPTVQATLENALARITGESIRVVASGRTDAGVHALAQVVSFQSETELGPDVLQRALNAELPRDIAVAAAEIAPHGFHATRDAKRKLYRYSIDDGAVRDVLARGHVWQLCSRMDERAMHRAAQALVGTHDFSSFETAGSKRESSVRTVFAMRD
jgi:tRNA pseudouridine38-40 synthase